MVTESDVIPGLLIVEREVHGDERGFFTESWRRDEFEKAAGFFWEHVQENHSRSGRNALRGIHIAPWSKMIYVPNGEILAAFVDCRRESPSFGRHQTLEMGDKHRIKVFVPADLGNSFQVLSDGADYQYQVNQYYVPGREKEVRWNDPDIAIDWPCKNPILSQRDQKAPFLRELYPDKF
jgi:dTDP-4-dehydrorhamnose 3,5-epimerase